MNHKTKSNAYIFVGTDALYCNLWLIKLPHSYLVVILRFPACVSVWVMCCACACDVCV